MQKKIILLFATLLVALVICGAASAATSSNDSLYSPKVKSTDPANNSYNIPTTKLIKISFTRNIYNPNKSLIKLQTYSDRKAAQVTYTIKDNAIYIDHNPLRNQRTYLLTINNGFVKNRSGNGSAAYSFRFKTKTTNLNSYNARLYVPKINSHYIRIRSDTLNAYNAVYHYSNSVYFGTPGECAMIGHRTTWSAPMRHINLLEKGDSIYVYDYTAKKKSTYSVLYHEVLMNYQLPRTFKKTGASLLVLKSCSPVGQAYAKYIVHAVLKSTLPL